MRSRRRKKKKRGIILVVLLLVLLGGGAGAFWMLQHEDEKAVQVPIASGPIINPLTGLEVESLPSRPFILSMDNAEGARPQSGLSKADIVYEFPVEGGMSRLEPIFYSQVPGKVGPARSARPYFVDLAREYRAVFCHHGWSPKAKAYLETGVVPYISAFTDTDIFYREAERKSPHNSYTTGNDIWTTIRGKGWDLKQGVRQFRFLKNTETQTGDLASEIAVNYTGTKNKYVYNGETGSYSRFVNEEPYIDNETGAQITTSNIMIQKVDSKVLDDKGRLSIDMTSGGDAILFTDGTALKGKWSRADLDSPTMFSDLQGNEFKLSPGTSWIQVVDDGVEVEYK